MTPHPRYGALLVRTMRLRGVTCKVLAAELHVNVRTVSDWRAGILPQVENAHALAFALSEPKLLTMARRPRSRTCLFCAEPFIDVSRTGRSTYCSRRCQRSATTRRLRGRTDTRRQYVTRRYAHQRETFRLFCAECEPEGVCRTPGCIIQARGDSPLRVSKRRAS